MLELNGTYGGVQRFESYQWSTQYTTYTGDKFESLKKGKKFIFEDYLMAYSNKKKYW